MHNKEFRKEITKAVREKKMLRKGEMKIGEAIALPTTSHTVCGVPVYVTIVIQDRDPEEHQKYTGGLSGGTISEQG